MLNNFETNEFHGDSVALEREKKKGFKCFTFEEGKNGKQGGEMEYFERTIF